MITKSGTDICYAKQSCVRLDMDSKKCLIQNKLLPQLLAWQALAMTKQKKRVLGSIHKQQIFFQNFAANNLVYTSEQGYFCSMCKDFCRSHLEEWDSCKNLCNKSVVCLYPRATNHTLFTLFHRLPRLSPSFPPFFFPQGVGITKMK